MDESIIRHCATCGETVKDENRMFCSKKCYTDKQKTGVYAIKSKRMFNCTNCGNLVIGKDKRGDVGYCNRKCYDEYRAKIVKSRKKICKRCGVEFLYAVGQEKRKYCSNKCRQLAAKATPRKCLNCKALFTPLKYDKKRNVLITSSDQHICSRECYIKWLSNNKERKEKISKAFSGKKHPNWQGGSGSVKRGYRGHGWSKQAEKVRKRDNYTCQHCGKTQEEHGQALDVHHLIPFRQDTSWSANNLKNLITLCKSCHTKADWEYRKKQNVQMVLI